MSAQIPRGFKDVLPDEAVVRETIADSILEVFKLWGYLPVETPTLETMSLFQAESYTQNATFKLFDSDGELLVLRPDVTLPIARLVGSRIGTLATGEALRLRYLETVFREERLYETKARSQTQLGVECIGLGGVVSDVEMLLLMAESLDAAKINDYTIALCTVNVLQAILDACVSNAPNELESTFAVTAATANTAKMTWKQAVLTTWHKSDLVGVDTLMRHPAVNVKYAQAISSLARIQGAGDAIDDCRGLIDDIAMINESSSEHIQRSLDSLDSMEETFQLACSLRPNTDWLVDFSLMSSFDYYTGLVFSAFAPQAGYPLGSGGRYDHTIARFGPPAKAIGFAFNLEQLVTSLLDERSKGSKPPPRVSPHKVLVDPANPAEAFRQAELLRAQGQQAVIEDVLGRRE
ncbi:MAG: ATP phosphoribosyltransferase regulatory subunit [Coriobacteriia bacterium]|nr:ATP phosphoribosyltransferase regulatory subunit [Coriobacteriia bacterium]